MIYTGIVALFCLLLSASPGPDKVLARNGTFVLNQSDLSLYFQILSFMIEESLTHEEQEEIKEEVIDAFNEYPEQIEAECWALSETLTFLNMAPGIDKVMEIRNNLFETLIEYEKKGNSNSFVRISRLHKPEIFLP